MSQIGVQMPLNIAEADLGEFSRFLRIHVEGTFLLVRSVSAVMQRQELKPIDAANPARGGTRGSIVTLGSGNSFAATPHLVQYTAAKHAVLGVTKNAGTFGPPSGHYPIWQLLLMRQVLALDNAPYGIRVNCVCPTWVETPMIQSARDGGMDIDSWVNKVVPLGRIATAEEVADTVIFLSSPRASYVTGSGFIIDGGTTLTCHA